MDEYIDREEVLRALSKNSITRKITVVDDVSVYDTVKNIPAADVVEVVRCKDCAYYSDFDAYEGKRFNFHFCKKFNNITLESDFCSYGEKMDEKENDHE